MRNLILAFTIVLTSANIAGAQPITALIEPHNPPPQLPEFQPPVATGPIIRPRPVIDHPVDLKADTTIDEQVTRANVDNLLGSANIQDTSSFQ